MTEWSSAVKNAVVVLIIVVVIGIVFGFLYMGMQSSESSQGAVSDALVGLSEKEMATYNGTAISGTEVINALESFKDRDIAIGVKTAGTNRFIYYNRSFNITPSTADKPETWQLTANPVESVNLPANAVDATGGLGTPQKPLIAGVATNKSTNLYVNQSAKFTSTLMKNANGVIVGIRFEQNI